MLDFSKNVPPAFFKSLHLPERRQKRLLIIFLRRIQVQIPENPIIHFVLTPVSPHLPQQVRNASLHIRSIHLNFPLTSPFIFF